MSEFEMCYHEMTAEEFREWALKNREPIDKWILSKYGDDKTFYDVFSETSAEEIVLEVERFKPPKTKWIDTCRIIEVKDTGVKECVYEEDLTSMVGIHTLVEGILAKFVKEHEGTFFATLSGRCVIEK